MSRFSRNSIVIGAFACIAIFGVLFSLSTPYISNDDELVYLAGALEAKGGNLPDAHMLAGYNDGPYLYPKVMLAWYDTLGYDAFKSILLAVLIVATGLSAYALFRLLWLPWVPALLLSIVALMPRFSSGQEIFGVLTFNEAIGRQLALPVFLIGTAFLIRRGVLGKSSWPLFGIFGLCLFLHPVTIVLFALVSLIALGVSRLYERTPVLRMLRELFICGIAFALAGAYFFVIVFERLSQGGSVPGVSAAAYAAAVVFRHPWEFPAATIHWFPHMAIVSAFFIALIGAFYALPALRSVRMRHPFPHARLITIWGFTVSASAIILTVFIPWLNLFLMERYGAPYVFQEWSRIAKFYYLGLFVILIPVVHVLWQWYRESQFRFKTVIVAILFIGGVCSSSFMFEVAQFVVHYSSVTEAYIPQALSGVADETTAQDYRETCRALAGLGATPAETIISNDFGLRYYCRANLYTTYEEGAAYFGLTRADLVSWQARYQAQDKALGSADPRAIFDFAKSIGARFIVVPTTSRYDAFASIKGYKVVQAARHTIVRIGQ